MAGNVECVKRVYLKEVKPLARHQPAAKDTMAKCRMYLLERYSEVKCS